MKNLLNNKWLLPVLCVVALIAMALPFYKTGVEGYGGTISLFNVREGGSSLIYVLILCPVVLLVANFLQQLAKYKKILSLAVPAICILVLIIVCISIKSGGSFGASVVDGLVDVDTSLSYGAIVEFIVYILMALVGAVQFYDFSFDKAGINNLKSNIKTAVPKKASDNQAAGNAGVMPNTQNANANVGNGGQSYADFMRQYENTNNQQATANNVQNQVQNQQPHPAAKDSAYEEFLKNYGKQETADTTKANDTSAVAAVTQEVIENAAEKAKKTTEKAEKAAVENTKIFCSQCGCENTNTDNFCEQCGAKLK